MASRIRYPTAEQTKAVFEKAKEWKKDEKLRGKWVAFAFNPDGPHVIASDTDPELLKKSKAVLEAQEGDSILGFIYLPAPSEESLSPF